MERERLNAYGAYLQEQEKSRNTVEKYLRDVRRFLCFVEEEGWTEYGREEILRYKTYLGAHYKKSSANSMLIALNGYLSYVGKAEWRVKIFRLQRKMFRDEEKELEYKEYRRLVGQAQKEGRLRLSCLLQTLGGTGIRISELPYITVECLKKGVVRIQLKGKERVILLPDSLVKLLRDYCRKMGQKQGPVFLAKSGKPLDRRSVWREMKALCRKAGVAESKVFPHNLRHLFASRFYEKEQDLARLADYLGHSSVETTRRYTMVSAAKVCRSKLELGFIVGKLCPLPEYPQEKGGIKIRRTACAT